MKRILAGVIPVAGLYVLARFTNFADVTLWAILATLPIAIVFILAYIPERPWRSWFGTSLLLLAVGVLSVCWAAAQFRLGFQWIGPNELGIIWVGFMFIPMLMRTWVLLAAQWRDNIGFGGWLRNFFH